MPLTRFLRDRDVKWLLGHSVVLVAAVAFLASCGQPGAEGAAEPDPPPEAGGDLEVEVLAEGLDTPWDVAFLSGDRILVTERPGDVRLVEDGEVREENYLTLESREIGEGGQLGLALDPDFEENGYLYAYFTAEDEGGDPVNRLVRLVEDAEAAGGVREDEVLLEGPAAGIHNGGGVAFGPDGRLYASLGDVDEEATAQDPDALPGSVFRINPDGTVPEDNPIEGSPVYAYGLRNTQGFDWHPDTGEMYATEHGPTARDEVNRIVAGENYGWPEVAGEGGEELGYTDPVIESGTETTWAPSGATFVGADNAWRGDFLFAGLRGSSLYRVVLDPEDPDRVEGFEEYLTDDFGRLRTVEEGPDGSLYVLTSNRDGRGDPAEEDDRLLRITPPE